MCVVVLESTASSPVPVAVAEPPVQPILPEVKMEEPEPHVPMETTDSSSNNAAHLPSPRNKFVSPGELHTSSVHGKVLSHQIITVNLI